MSHGNEENQKSMNDNDISGTFGHTGLTAIRRRVSTCIMIIWSLWCTLIITHNILSFLFSPWKHLLANSVLNPDQVFLLHVCSHSQLENNEERQWYCVQDERDHYWAGPAPRRSTDGRALMALPTWGIGITAKNAHQKNKRERAVRVSKVKRREV